MTQKDLFEWHIDKALKEWNSLHKTDVMKAYEKAEQNYKTEVENLNLANASQQHELLIAFCEFAEQCENHDLNSHGLVNKWINKSNLYCLTNK